MEGHENHLDNIKTDASIKLVFCDVNMPIMDGIKATFKIRKFLNSKMKLERQN